MVHCIECDAAVLTIPWTPRRFLRESVGEVGTTDLTCPGCGQGYLSPPLPGAMIQGVGAVLTVGVLGAAFVAISWAGRAWILQAFELLVAGQPWLAALHAAVFALLSSGALVLAVAAIQLLNASLTAVAWRLGAYQLDDSRHIDRDSLRVEHRGRPALLGYRDEKVLIDGRVVGPSTGSHFSNARESWFRIREGAEDVDCYLKTWGTGLDVAHVLFRNGELWSSKKAGRPTSALIFGALLVVLVEAIWLAIQGQADAPLWVIALSAVSGALLGTILDLGREGPTPSVAPPGIWQPVDGAGDEVHVLRVGGPFLMDPGASV